MHDLPLYPQFPGGYDHVLVPSVLGLKTRCEHLATRVELRTLTSVFVGGLLGGWGLPSVVSSSRQPPTSVVGPDYPPG
jgi:hypothetical protein